MRFYDILYDNPYAAFLFILMIPFVIFYWLLWKKRQTIINLFSQSSIIDASSGITFLNRSCAFLLACTFAVIALMEPKGNPHYVDENRVIKQKVLRRRPHDVIILFDASASMLVTDTRTQQTRFDYGKDIADEIVRHLNQDSVAIYAFTTEPTLLSPLTMDYLFARLMLKNIKINEGDISGTNIRNALSDIHQNYLASPSIKRKTIIILSDGGDTSIEAMKGDEKNASIEKLASVVDDSTKFGYRVFTIGLGSEKGGLVPDVGSQVNSVLQKELLIKISSKGNGQFYMANEYNPLEISNRINQFLNKFEKSDETSSLFASDNLIYNLYFQIPLGFSLFFIGYGLLFPEIKKNRIRNKNENLVSA